jgi:hypothetical protein
MTRFLSDPERIAYMWAVAADVDGVDVQPSSFEMQEVSCHIGFGIEWEVRETRVRARL